MIKMSIGERGSGSSTAIQPAYINIPGITFNSLGGGFSQGEVGYKILTDNGNITSGPVLAHIVVRNAVWSGTTTSPFLMLQNVNKRLIMVLDDVPASVLRLGISWDSNNRVVSTNIYTSDVYPGTPQYNSFLVYLDVN